MDRAEATGLGVATAGHIALLAILSVSLAVSRLPPPPSPPIEVSFVKDVGPVNSAPQPVPRSARTRAVASCAVWP